MHINNLSIQTFIVHIGDAESYQDDGDYKRHNLDSLRELHAQRSLATQSLSSYSRKLTDISNIEFFFPLADEFKCPVCMTLINEPQLTSCGHRFCKDCIDPVTQEPNPECPICNEPKFNMMPDRSIVRKINSLKIHCINREDGCQWTGELATLDNHLEEQCSISVSEVSSKFESLGCKEKTTQRDVDAHVSGELLSHVTSFMEMFEAHQKAFQHILDENSARIRQVEQYVDQVEEKITRDLNNKSCIKWNDINLHRLFELKTGDRASVKRCLVPDRLVPNEAREVLFLVVMHSGNTSQFPSSTHHISLYVEEAGMRYTKYLRFTSYKQDAWNSNTENMWLPMPSDRMVHVHVPIDLKSNIRCNIFLAGYR